MNDDVLVPSRFLSVLFADDIRQEVGGKLTIVGVYQSKMLFSKLPAVLPKLAVVMTAGTPASRPFQKLVFQLYRDEELIQSFELEAETLPVPPAVPSGSDDGTQIIEAQFATVLGPLSIDAPCTLTTRIETESGMIPGRALVISTS